MPAPFYSHNYYDIKAMKRIFTIIPVLFFFFCFFLYSCQQKVKQDDHQTEFEQDLTNTDSIKVIELLNTFFSYAEEGNYDDAAAMLFKVDKTDLNKMPEPLDNEEMESVKSLLRTLRIQSHRIDYIKFNEYYLNEAKCTAVLIPAHDGIPEATTVFYFKPVDYIDSWMLCMMNSVTDDNPFVKEEDKAQLTREYKADQAAKAAEVARADSIATSEHPQ